MQTDSYDSCEVIELSLEAFLWPNMYNSTVLRRMIWHMFAVRRGRVGDFRITSECNRMKGGQNGHKTFCRTKLNLLDVEIPERKNTPNTCVLHGKLKLPIRI